MNDIVPYRQRVQTAIISAPGLAVDQQPRGQGRGQQPVVRKTLGGLEDELGEDMVNLMVKYCGSSSEGSSISKLTNKIEEFYIYIDI